MVKKLYTPQEKLVVDTIEREKMMFYTGDNYTKIAYNYRFATLFPFDYSGKLIPLFPEADTEQYIEPLDVEVDTTGRIAVRKSYKVLPSPGHESQGVLNDRLFYVAGKAASVTNHVVEVGRHTLERLFLEKQSGKYYSVDKFLLGFYGHKYLDLENYHFEVVQREYACVVRLGFTSSITPEVIFATKEHSFI